MIGNKKQVEWVDYVVERDERGDPIRISADAPESAKKSFEEYLEFSTKHPNIM